MPNFVEFHRSVNAFTQKILISSNDINYTPYSKNMIIYSYVFWYIRFCFFTCVLSFINLYVCLFLFFFLKSLYCNKYV